MSRRVAAVVPVFRPPADFGTRVRALADDVDHVVVVDDGSGGLAQLSIEHPRITQISLADNSGIARALNVGIEAARSAGAELILTLDQDSTAPPGYVDRAVATLEAARGAGVRVGAVVPETVGTQQVMRRRGTAYAFDPIQAGQLIPAEVLDRVGPFAEELFIDAVDSDFTIRAENLGYEFVVAEGSTIAHGLGELVPLMVFGRQVVIAGKPRHVLYHAPFRTYYMARNSVVLIRRHRHGRARWMVWRTWKMTEMIVGCVVLSPDRGAQLRALALGIRDGARDRLGRITAATEARLRGRRSP